MREEDRRAEIMASLLTTPHRDLARLAPVHVQSLESDPAFYCALAVDYILGRGDKVRDHQVQFVAHMFLADYEQVRSAAWVLLQSLSVHQIGQMTRYVKTVLAKRPPRIMRNAVEYYLRQLEAAPYRLDEACVRGRADIRFLYVTYSINASDTARAFLFREQKIDGVKQPMVAPEWSKVRAIQRLAHSTDPLEQAEIILDAKLPYPIASTAFGSATGGQKLSAPVLIALIANMTPAEASNHQASMQKHGAYDDPEVKRLLIAKIEAFAKDRRTSSLRAARAATAVQTLDADAKAALVRASDNKLAGGRRISYPLAVCVDKSSSQQTTIAAGIRGAAVLAAMCDKLHLLFFDVATMRVDVQKHTTLSALTQATALIKAGGATSLGSPIEWLLRKRVEIDHLVFFTDVEETRTPNFVPAYQEYAQEMKRTPEVTFLEIGKVDQAFYPRLDQAGIAYNRIAFTSDDYSMTQLVGLLGKASRGEVISAILATPLPNREEYLAQRAEKLRRKTNVTQLLGE